MTFTLLASLMLAAPPADDAPAETLETSRAEAKPGSIEDLYYRGAAHYSASDYQEAIVQFTQALDLAGRQGTDPAVRAALLFNLARAHTRAYDVDTDVRHLRQAVDIHRRFIDEAKALSLDVPEQVEAAKVEIAGIQSKLESLETAERERRERDEDPRPSPSGTSPAVPDSASTPRRARGIALTASGGAALAGGIGLVIFGTTFRRDALAVVARIDDPPQTEEAFVDAETRKGRAWVGAGVGLAGVGAGLAVWGIVDLASARKRRTTISGAPWLDPGVGGAVITGRF